METLKQISWETKTFLKKLECRFLVEGTKIENALFPYKTVMSEVNVKTNRMVSTKWTTKWITNDGVLPVTNWIFLKKFVSV